MAVPSVTSTGHQARACRAAAPDRPSDRFPKLLVAQMQNQDPLNPMDNAQVTSQMAQIQTVTGIDKLNTTVAGLNSQFVQMQALQGASLVGRDVIVPGNLMDIDDGVGQGGFELTSAADAGQGRDPPPRPVVDTIRPGAQSAGPHSFDWAAGSATNDTGPGRFRVIASRLGSVNTTATALMRDSVSARQHHRHRLQPRAVAHAAASGYTDVKAFN